MRIVLLCLLIFLAIFAVCYKKRKREGYFRQLGALAPYKELYYGCLDRCDKVDRTKQLIPTMGNFKCQNYCDNYITELSRLDRDKSLAKKLANSYKKNVGRYNVNEFAYQVCGSERISARCRERVASDKVIAERCRTLCDSSDQDQASCVLDCFDNQLAPRTTMGTSFEIR